MLAASLGSLILNIPPLAFVALGGLLPFGVLLLESAFQEVVRHSD